MDSVDINESITYTLIIVTAICMYICIELDLLGKMGVMTVADTERPLRFSI